MLLTTIFLFNGLQLPQQCQREAASASSAGYTGSSGFSSQWPTIKEGKASVRLPPLATQAHSFQSFAPATYNHFFLSRHQSEAASSNRSGYTSSSGLPSCGLQLQQAKQAHLLLLLLFISCFYQCPTQAPEADIKHEAASAENCDPPFIYPFRHK